MKNVQHIFVKKIILKKIVPEAEKCGLMGEMSIIIKRVVDHASSLILNVTNNVCEQFNSVVNK
jgi:hypothetical protein